jgi:hypothetical protein
LNALGSRARAAAWAVVPALMCGSISVARAGEPDSLLLRAPADVTVSSVYRTSERKFVNYITWDDIPDAEGTLVEAPSLEGWGVTTPPAQLSSPSARGPYTGDIDRTVLFTAQKGGTVGADSLVFSYEIRLEEDFDGRIVLTPAYTPGDWVSVRFGSGGATDFGLQVSFSDGIVDRFGTFSVGLQDFEGFHIWRGVNSDGSDLVVVGELSKQEAYLGGQTGGNLVDSLYFYDVIPTLRQDPPWISPFGAIDCLGVSIDVPLESNEFFWYDCDAANGFTYYYVVTTFDRGYTSSSSQQGLVKVDHCYVSSCEPRVPGVDCEPYACPDELVKVSMEVEAQSDLYNVYVVPNPFRSGPSRLTAPNYHNFPDENVRFVNVPHDCTIRIFTVSGDLVWENEQIDDGGNVTWDLRNRSSEDVSSGVYIYRVVKPDGDAVFGRIVVIR